MRRTGLFLLLLATGARTGEPADAPRWHETREAAQAAAKRARRPVACVLLEPGQPASRRLDAALGRRTLGRLLARFECVRLPAGEQRALAAKYGIKHKPAIVVFTSVGTPLKLLAGPMPASKVRAQLEDALEKHAAMWRPKRRRPAAPGRTRRPEKRPPARFHAAACPRGCVTCAPALKRGYLWLRRRQRDDGRWRKRRTERAGVESSLDRVDIALTAVAGLALLASEREAERAAAERAGAFLVRHTRPDGIVALSRDNDPMLTAYAHFETPMTAMLLAELEKAAPDEERGRALARIADYLVKAQSPRGAWGYGPDFTDHPAYARRGWRLLATSHTCLTALCWARAAGAGVPDETLERGRDFVLSCRGKDGGFVYRAEQRHTPGVPGSTAGALVALQATGLLDRAELDTLWTRYRRDWDEIDAFGRHRFWFLLHTALAFSGRGPGALDAFDRRFRDALLAEQEEAGSWHDQHEAGGRVLATAAALLSLERLGKLEIATRRADAPEPKSIAVPDYLEPAFASSRVKVFSNPARGAGAPAYLFDLVVSTEAAATKEERARIGRGLLAANRVLFDLTDGQLALHRATVVDRRRRWDEADIRITREFFDADKNPHPGALGITRLRRRTVVRAGRERRGRRAGEWILFPPGRVPWESRRAAVVVAHELAHYLFGVRDEYGHCECVMALAGRTELCTEDDHTDERREAACWTLARGLYPRLRAPRGVPDPGPWEPPEPVVEIPGTG